MRRGVRRLAVATLAAAVVAVGATGWALAERQGKEDAQRAAHGIANVKELERLIASFGRPPLRVRLASRTARRAMGAAVIYSAPRAEDLIVVSVVPPRRSKGPYRYELLDNDGKVLSGGRLEAGTEQLMFYELSGTDLSRGDFMFVYDGRGRAILQGAVGSSGQT